MRNVRGVQGLGAAQVGCWGEVSGSFASGKEVRITESNQESNQESSQVGEWEMVETNSGMFW